MRTGLRTKSGADPLVAWRSRLHWIGDSDLVTATRSLLAGESVLAVEGVLEIAALEAATPQAYTVSVRRSSVPYVVELVVSVWDDGPDPNPRAALPAPERWSTDAGEGQIRWEFFNCIFHILRTRGVRK